MTEGLIPMMIAVCTYSGVGLGINRLVMLLTQNKSIKEVIAFPTMKLR